MNQSCNLHWIFSQLFIIVTQSWESAIILGKLFHTLSHFSQHW